MCEFHTRFFEAEARSPLLDLAGQIESGGASDNRRDPSAAPTIPTLSSVTLVSSQLAATLLVRRSDPKTGESGRRLMFCLSPGSPTRERFFLISICQNKSQNLADSYIRVSLCLHPLRLCCVLWRLVACRAVWVETTGYSCWDLERERVVKACG